MKAILVILSFLFSAAVLAAETVISEDISEETLSEVEYVNSEVEVDEGDFDNWSHQKLEDGCIINAGVIGVHPGGETRLVINFYTALGEGQLTKIGMEINKPELLIVPHDNTLADGYEIVIETNNKPYRALPTAHGYRLNSEETANLLRASKKQGGFELHTQLADGNVCEIEMDYKYLGKHIDKSIGCGYENLNLK